MTRRYRIPMYKRVIRAVRETSASGLRCSLLHRQIAGSPLSFSYRRRPKGQDRHQGNDLGYGNNAEDWVTCSQTLRAPAYGCSSTTRRRWVLGGGLRYSLLRAERPGGKVLLR